MWIIIPTYVQYICQWMFSVFTEAVLLDFYYILAKFVNEAAGYI